MNKILKSLLSVAIISASFASCSQVDTIDDLNELKKSTSVTLNKHADWSNTTTIVFATNTYGLYNRVFYYNNNGTTLNNIPTGEYKFYAINRSSEYEYENIDLNKLPVDSLYYGDVFVASKTSELNIADEGVKRVLAGKYLKISSHEVFADSTMLVNVKMGQNISATFEKPYTLTKKYTISGTFLSSSNVEKIYVELGDIIARKKPNGGVAGSQRIKCVLEYNVARNSQKNLERNLTILGIATSGTANVYVRCKGDDKSKTPESKSVRYTVKDGIINLGDITF